MGFSLFDGVSIFIAVPSTLGSNNSFLMLAPSVSGAVACLTLSTFGRVPDGCTCTWSGANGTSYSSFAFPSWCISMSDNWFITSSVSLWVAGFITVPFTEEVLAFAGCVAILIVTGVLGVVGLLLLTGRGRLRGLVLYFSAAILPTDSRLLRSTLLFFLGGEGGLSVILYCE